MELLRPTEAESPSWHHGQKRGYPSPRTVGNQLDGIFGKTDGAAKEVDAQGMQFHWMRANGLSLGIG